MHLTLFAAIIALPLLALLAVMLHRSVFLEHQRLGRQLGQELDELVAVIDRDIERRIAVLQTLATAPSLAAEDWPAFHAQATASLGGGNYLVLMAADGRQLVNTYVPHGQEPQVTGDPATIEALRRTIKPVVSDLFTSLVTRRSVYNISIPIVRDGQLRYVMSLGLFPQDLLALLQEQHLEPGWTTAIWDRNGVLMAHSRDHGKWVGKPVPDGWRTQPKGEPFEDRDFEGEAVLAQLARPKLAGWTIRAAFPARLVDAQIEQSLWLWGLGAGLITVLTAAAAYVFGWAFTRPLAETAEAAAALGRGEPVRVDDTRIAEVNAVNRALRQASEDLEAGRTALRYSEQLLGTAADVAQFGAHQYDAVNDRVYRSPQIRRILGAETVEERDFEAAQAFVHPEDRDEVRWRKQQILRSEEQYQLTYRIRRPDGEVRWVLDRGQVDRDAEGKALRVVGVLVDITDLKAAEQRQRLVFDELNHRVKNTLAIVQSLAQHTLNSSPDPKAFAQAFGERLQSLSRAHDLLARTAWQAVALHDVAAAVLEPFMTGEGRVDIRGEAVDLPANITITLALMLNELATNAAKYGAMTGDAGTVGVSWTVTPIGDALAVDLIWRELGGPPVVKPERRGFGSRLLAASAQQIKGELRIDYAVTGVLVRLHFAVPKPSPDASFAARTG
ncbi:MAG TPA: HWE histidine kinase domain-containing protein [Reyranella sp.]|nr:HWE histidine kinase domain-containing protein [Reyranella sp.]